MTKTEQNNLLKPLSKKEKEQILNLMVNQPEKSNIKIETKRFNGYDENWTRDDDFYVKNDKDNDTQNGVVIDTMINGIMYSNKYICVICNNKYDSTKELYYHTKKCHDFNKQQYLTYLMDEYGEGYCIKCQNQVTRIVGYAKKQDYTLHGIYFVNKCNNCLKKDNITNPYIGNSHLYDDD